MTKHQPIGKALREFGRRMAAAEEGKTFTENGIVRSLIFASFIGVAGSFAVLGYYLRPTGSPAVLHYNVYFGVDLLGAWWQVYLVPAGAVLFLLTNVFLASGFYDARERIAAYVLLLASVFVEWAALVASIAAALVNY